MDQVSCALDIDVRKPPILIRKYYPIARMNAGDVRACLVRRGIAGTSPSIFEANVMECREDRTRIRTPERPC
eukprot:6206580-Pleurochrysis_carterae.AAC.1